MLKQLECAKRAGIINRKEQSQCNWLETLREPSLKKNETK